MFNILQKSGMIYVYKDSEHVMVMYYYHSVQVPIDNRIILLSY